MVARGELECLSSNSLIGIYFAINSWDDSFVNDIASDGEGQQ